MKTRTLVHRKVTAPSQSLLTRRQFMGGLAIASAAFQVVPGSVLGLNGATSPNEKLNLGGVGVGGQGGGDLANMESENIIALCDVDWASATEALIARSTFGKSVTRSKSYLPNRA